MKRQVRFIFVHIYLSLTLISVFMSPVNATVDTGLFEGELSWHPTNTSQIHITYSLSESAGEGQTDYTLATEFLIHTPVQLNGTIENWIVGGRNFSIQIYGRIETDFYLFQHILNRSEFGVQGNIFGDTFIFSLPESYDAITLDYSMFSYFVENTTEYHHSGSGTGSITVIDEINPYYPRSFKDISGEIHFHQNIEEVFVLDYDIKGDERESPQIEMGFNLSPFSYEQPMLGKIEGLPHYGSPMFIFGCAIFNITYTNSGGWVNQYVKDYDLNIGTLKDIRESEMATGVSKTLTVDSGSTEMDTIKLRLIMDLYLFNWDLQFIFEKKPFFMNHFFRTYAAILIAIGIIAVITTFLILRIRELKLAYW